MLEDYFAKITLNQEYAAHTLGATIHTNHSSFPSLENKKIAFFSLESEDWQDVRTSLYQLAAIPTLKDKVIDLGSLKLGKTPKDTTYAIQHVVSTLVSQGAVAVILSNNVDYGEAIYHSYENLDQNIELSHISALLPILQGQLLHRICLHEPNYLLSLNTIGYQKHYAGDHAISLLENLGFGEMRLGLVKANIENTELYLRNANVVLYNMDAIKYSDAPGQATVQPNGLQNYEACQLARYAGLSDVLTTFGLFGYKLDMDQRGLTAHLCAQILWYFADGVANRSNDRPGLHNEFVKYRCNFAENNEAIVFLKSKRTTRWWMQIEHPADPTNSKQAVTVPCSYTDYTEAASGTPPQRYLNALKKLA